ncbi:50S ribosomal protein L11 methyltransferase, partial [Sphaeroforma arctica JP610]
MILTLGDIAEKRVADLGCGPGVLSIAAEMLGADYVCGFELDEDVIEIAQRNIDEMECDLEIVQCDVTTLRDYDN